MKITGIRIDQRLLHGIVATQWIPMSKCERIMIIDDHTANDFILKEMMKLCKPANTNISVLTEKIAIENMKLNKYNKQKIYILIKDIHILYNLLDITKKIPTINVGIMEKKANSMKAYGRIYITSEEFSMFKDLIDKGLSFNIQYVPSDDSINLEDVIKKVQ